MTRDGSVADIPRVRVTERVVRDGTLVAAEGVVMTRREADRFGILDVCEEYDGPLTSSVRASVTGRPLPGLVRTAVVPAPETTAGSGRGGTPPTSGGAEAEYPRAAGGGWYELSNGERVRGKAAAREAQAGLDEE